MTTVAAVSKSAGETPVVICDVSPPRGGTPDLMSEIEDIDADFLSVAYSPGQSVRVNPVICAAHIQNEFGRSAIFTLATRDMNRIAIQSLLLGASMAGLENVVALRGDPIRKRDRPAVRSVNDYTTTALVEDIHRMNLGVDFRGLPLRSGTSFCVGVVTDPSLGVEDEVALTRRKIRSGSDFILCQAQFDAGRAEDFASRVSRDEKIETAHEPLIFHGVQVFDVEGVNFGNVPNQVVEAVRLGGDGLEIAKQCARELWDVGVRRFYIAPPILRGGARDYERANELIQHIRRMESGDV